MVAASALARARSGLCRGLLREIIVASAETIPAARNAMPETVRYWSDPDLRGIRKCTDQNERRAAVSHGLQHEEVRRVRSRRVGMFQEVIGNRRRFAGKV